MNQPPPLAPLTSAPQPVTETKQKVARSKSKGNRMSGQKQRTRARPTVVVSEEHGRGKRWMSASPIAIITLCLTLAFNVGQIGFTYAYVLGRLDANALAVQRVENDVRERNLAALRLIEDRHQLVMKTMEERQVVNAKAVDRLDSSLGAMSALRTDVEVVKNKLTTIDETLRRVERYWDRDAERNNPPSPRPAR